MNFDSSVLQVAIEDIIPNRFQPRLSFEDSSLRELSDSIKQHGVIQPLVLRRIGDKYEIIAGERRYKAATMAGLSSVPAVISQIDDKTSAEVAVVENVQRRDLTAIEEARSYKALLDQGYMSQEQLAKKMGLSQGAISNKLRLLNLATDVQDAILENKISERHARALLVVKEHSDQIKWLNRIISERLTVRQLDEELRKEYKGDTMNANIDIEQIKQNAMDINTVSNSTTMQMPSPSPTPFTMGPIDLGQKTVNKFFNSLEDQEVNMQMTEAINPFSHFNDANLQQPINQVSSSMTPNTSGIIVESPKVDQNIDLLDSLDFEPPKTKIDITPAKNRINNLIKELKSDFDIELIEKSEEGKTIYTITIKEINN